MKAARSKGGKMTAINGRRRKLDSIEALVKFNEMLIDDVLSGKMGSDLARALVMLLQLQARMLVDSLQEARIAALEERVTRQSGVQRWSA
jgi:hypothetical protein